MTWKLLQQFTEIESVQTLYSCQQNLPQLVDFMPSKEEGRFCMPQLMMQLLCLLHATVGIITIRQSLAL